MVVGCRDGAGGGLAVSLDPSRQEPAGRVQYGGVEAGEPLGAFAGNAPQHRVGELGEMHRLAIGLHQTDREVHGGMVRHIQKENLRRAK